MQLGIWERIKRIERICWRSSSRYIIAVQKPFTPGHVDTTVKFGEEKIGRSKFITHARDLCLRSITKILDEGKFTDWDSLILGGEVVGRGKQLNLSV